MSDNFDINKPPFGTWIRWEADHTLILGASSRSFLAAFVITIFVFISGVLALFFIGFQVAPLIGFPIDNLSFDPFWFAIGVFFLFIFLVLVKYLLQVLFGKDEITLTRSNGKLFVGFRNWGKTEDFLMDDLINVHEGPAATTSRSQPKTQIVMTLQGGKRITFGESDFTSPIQRAYIIGALQKVLSDRAQNKDFLKENLLEHFVDGENSQE